MKHTTLLLQRKALGGFRSVPANHAAIRQKHRAAIGLGVAAAANQHLALQASKGLQSVPHSPGGEAADYTSAQEIPAHAIVCSFTSFDPFCDRKGCAKSMIKDTLQQKTIVARVSKGATKKRSTRHIITRVCVCMWLAAKSTSAACGSRLQICSTLSLSGQVRTD